MLLIHGLQQSDIPISQLSGALARMSQALTDIGTPLFGAAAADPRSDLLRAACAREITVCIESLQFHDRLMQQLSQARDLLTASAPQPLVPGPPANDGSIQGTIELF